MSKKPDPRKPRRNPELKDIEKVIRSNWRDFSKEKDHTRRRGYGMILQAALEQWLDEPEFLMDLMEGRVEPRDPGREDPALTEGAETLFERSGEAEDTFFYLSYSNVATTVFVGRDSDPHNPWQLSAYWVLLLEKIFVTENETLNHFTSEATFYRHVGRRPMGRVGKGEFAVLCDPRGYYDGRSSMLAAKYVKETRAREKAKELAREFDIRFAVARMVAAIHTH